MLCHEKTLREHSQSKKFRFDFVCALCIAHSVENIFMTKAMVR